MGTADDFLDRYAALPSAERSSAGVRPPSASLHLSVLYRPIQPPSSSMKRAGVQSDQSVPCQNSFLSRPKKPSIAALSELQPLADWIGYTDVDSSGRGARDGRAVYAFLRESRGEGLPGYVPVNSVYVFDDRVVLNINFTDDAKTVTREEVLGSSAMDNVPVCWGRTHLRESHDTRGAAVGRQKHRCPQ